MPQQDRLAIGELSKRTGVNIETIRYFERVGMLATPPRSEGGRRVYDLGHVRTLAFIKRTRELGFSPADVRAILLLGGPGAATCGEVREIAALHLDRVRAKMADLVQVEKLLASTIERCEGDGTPDCAVMDLLEDRS